MAWMNMTFVRLMDVAVGGPLWNKVAPGLERGLRRLCRYDDGALACDCVRFFKWLPTLMDESTYVRRPSLLWKWKASGVLQLKGDYKWLFLVWNLNVHVSCSGGDWGTWMDVNLWRVPSLEFSTKDVKSLPRYSHMGNVSWCLCWQNNLGHFFFLDNFD